MFKHHRYPKAIILQAVYFKLRFTLSYRDVDKYGDTIDFLLTKRRMKGSAQKFLNKAIRNNGKPRIIKIDKSGANKEGIKTFNKQNFWMGSISAIIF